MRNAPFQKLVHDFNNLVSFERIRTRTIVSLVGNTTSSKGLRVIAELDEGKYAKGVVVPRAVMPGFNIKRIEFWGEWNYDILSSLLPRSDE